MVGEESQGDSGLRKNVRGDEASRKNARNSGGASKIVTRGRGWKRKEEWMTGGAPRTGQRECAGVGRQKAGEEEDVRSKG